MWHLVGDLADHASLLGRSLTRIMPFTPSIGRGVCGLSYGTSILGFRKDLFSYLHLGEGGGGKGLEEVMLGIDSIILA